MYYCQLTPLTEPTPIAFLYFLPQTHTPQTHALSMNDDTRHPLILNNMDISPVSTYMHCPEKDQLVSLKTETHDEQTPPSSSLASLPPPSKRETQKATPFSVCAGSQVKLDFRMEWTNDNRNIVPNLVNQMMSFLFKKNKSGRLIQQLFSLHPHGPGWSVSKFYQYMKKIRDSVCHYVNQGILRHFFVLHQPKCEIYSEAEQEYYMKLCRIAVRAFLAHDAITVSLTSARMAKSKRLSHLVAREALLRKFRELAQA